MKDRRKFWSLTVSVAAFALLTGTTSLSNAAASPPIGTAQHKSVHVTAISVISEDDVWVVGSHMKEQLTKPFAEHWDGTSWTIADLPKVNIRGNSWFAGVDAIAPDDVWAVGTVPKGWRPRPLVMHFDGTSWDARNPKVFHSLPGGLTGVADAGPADVWMVGPLNDGRTVTAHWDGERLRGSDLRDPQFASVVGVCLPGPGRALAVGMTTDGGRERPRVEKWDGARWRIEPAPDPGKPLSGFQAVTCSADTDAWAVGRANTLTHMRPLVAHRTADGWTEVSELEDFNAQFAGVVETGPDDVWAVGYRKGRGKTVVPWVEHGTDGAGVGGTVPHSVAGAKLAGVDADATDDVWVAGNDGDGEILVDRWDGSQWVRMR